MLHHALLVQRKHSQDPGSECFWRKTFYWSTHCPWTPTVVRPEPSRSRVDHYLVRFLPSFTTPRTNILDIRGQFSRIHLGLKLISEMGLEIHACFPIFKNGLRELVSDYRRDHITGIYRRPYLGTFTIFGLGSDDLGIIQSNSRDMHDIKCAKMFVYPKNSLNLLIQRFISFSHFSRNQV